MKVRIAYTVEAPKEFRRAIRAYYGQTGLATRQEVQDWLYRFGESMNDDLSVCLEREANRQEDSEI